MMKGTLWALSLLFILCMSGCTSNTTTTNSNATTVKPYPFTKEDQALLQLTPVEQGNMRVYDVNIANKQDEIRLSLEYYHNGEKMKDIDAFSTSNFLDENVKLSFGQQKLQYEDDTRQATLWFINTTDASVKFVDDSLPEWSASSFTSIEKEKKINYNEKAVLGAWICTTKEDGSISSISPDNDELTKRLIKENEHVYLFVMEMKSGDVSK